jgi:hypothetical protein
MQFQVPQFIEVEDKIFGPLTFKQFVYIFGGLGASYTLFRLLPLILAAPLIAVVGGLAAGLAFFQFNGRPLIVGLENAFYFLIHGKLYLWNNARKAKRPAPAAKIAPQAPQEQVYVPKLSDSRLHELAWSLDIKERVAAGVAGEDERQSIRSQEHVVVPIRTAREALVR